MTRTRTTDGPRALVKRARRRSQAGMAIDYNAPAADVQAAIAALSGIGQGGVSVAGQGTPFNPFVVTFTGALAATSVSLTANYSGISTGSGSQPGTTTQTSWGGPGTDEQEVVGYAATGDYGVTGGEFDLTYNAQTTAVAGKRAQGRGHREEGTGKRAQGTGNREQGRGHRGEMSSACSHAAGLPRGGENATGRTALTCST